MTPDRWRQIEKVYHSALEREEDERAAFLQDACAGDELLRQEVESLLAEGSDAEGFPEMPLWKAAAELLGEADLVGQRVGPYEVLSVLGQGGMGKVYLALDTILDRKVALKFLSSGFRKDPSACRRFLREAQSAAAIDHPYVCKIYAVLEEQGKPCIAMEFLKGETLKERLARWKTNPLPWDEVRRIGLEILEALAATHQDGYVHRDLKPSNVMLTLQGHIKILDFGLARRVVHGVGAEPETRLTLPGTFLGTPAYMSPEQARAEAIQQHTDLFSLGVILYEMLTGTNPFIRQSPMATALAIVSEPEPPLSRVNPGCPLALQQIVHKLLAKSVSERYQSAVEALDDLRRMEGISSVVIPGPRQILYSIVVLPFANQSDDPEQEEFSDGITEEVIAQLSKIAELRVIARTSSMRYKGSPKPIAEIARELGVQAVLEGTVRSGGNRIRITCGLIDVLTEKHIWAEVYERESRDLFNIQSDLAQEIAAALQLTLSPAQKQDLRQKGPEMMEAYWLYLKGRYFLSKLAPEEVQKGIRFFQQSLDLEPTFARAYAGISACHAYLGHIGYLSLKKTFPKARAAAQKALELDDRLAEAHRSMALVELLADWNWRGAEKSFRKALLLNPNFVEGYIDYSWLLTARLRFEEALSKARQAAELDPLSPFPATNLGWVLANAGRPDEALEQFHNALEIAPEFQYAKACRALAYIGKKMYGEAVQVLEEAAWNRSQLAMAYAVAGRAQESEIVLEAILQSNNAEHHPFTDIGITYLLLGNLKKGFECLERACQERDPGILYLNLILNILPVPEAARADPRLAGFLSRLGLQE